MNHKNKGVIDIVIMMMFLFAGLLVSFQNKRTAKALPVAVTHGITCQQYQDIVDKGYYPGDEDIKEHFEHDHRAMFRGKP